MMYSTALSQDCPKRYNGKGHAVGVDDRPRSRLQGNHDIGSKFRLVLNGRSVICVVHQTNLKLPVLKVALGVVVENQFVPKKSLRVRDRTLAWFDFCKLLGIDGSSLLKRCKDFTANNQPGMRITSNRDRKTQANARSRNAKNYKRLSSIAIR